MAGKVQKMNNISKFNNSAKMNKSEERPRPRYGAFEKFFRIKKLCIFVK